MLSAQSSGHSVRDVVDRVLALPDEGLSTAEFFLADWKVRFRSTCSKTTEIYSRRLRSRKPISDSSACLTLNILETNALGWAPPASYSEWRGAPGHFESILKRLGFGGVYPNAIEGERTEPCTIFDAGRQTGMQLIADIVDLPPWDGGAPCRILLHLAAVSRRWCLVHAATLGLLNGGVLIVGPGGAGKSGTTLAGISAGLKTAGDDYVLVCPSSPPIAYRVYNLLKQDQNGLTRIDAFSARATRFTANWQNKLELDPEELFPGCVVERMTLRAILAPVIARAPCTRIYPVEPQHVFQKLAPSLWSQLPGAQKYGFRFASWLTRSLPTFSVQLSDHPPEIGDRVGSFIAGLAA